MKRKLNEVLIQWKDDPRRKPLVLRGARQVGKSWLVRNFADAHMHNLLEINFEQQPNAADLFSDQMPEKIVSRLELFARQEVIPGKTLLFLDEIQAAPQVFACLRYFYEQLPALHVVAAGSLLEFALGETHFPMPVGRIEYLHMGPMSYEEFLAATDRTQLANFLATYQIGEELPGTIHDHYMKAFREYLVVGGMPEAVQSYVDTSSFLKCDQVKQSILSTYQEDFGKYGSRINLERLQQVFQKIPQQVGGKMTYSRIDRNAQARDLRAAMRLLCKARVMYPVHHSHANGVPLGAEIDERKFKALFLDVGLLCRSCGLSLLDFEEAEDILLVNAGAVCEQFIGQHLLYSRAFYEEPELHYWSRDKRQSSAEVDYLFTIGRHLVPTEVKAGKTGRLKSLHVFLKEKKLSFGLRFNADLPSLLDDQASLTNGDYLSYRLLSLPLYMVGQARRLCRDSIGGAN